MAGNVWQWTNDWYLTPTTRSVRSTIRPADPAAAGRPAPYHTLRGGSWAQGRCRRHDRQPRSRRSTASRCTTRPTPRSASASCSTTASPVQPGATVTTVATNLKSGQGVAADASGNVYFADAGDQHDLRSSPPPGSCRSSRPTTAGLSGLKVDARGNVVACQSSPARSSRSIPRGRRPSWPPATTTCRSTLPTTCGSIPRAGSTVTDPGSTSSQPQDVYYISPDRTDGHRGDHRPDAARPASPATPTAPRST